MKHLAERSAERRRRDTRQWLVLTASFAGIALVSFGLLFLGPVDPPQDSIWRSLRMGALIVGILAAVLVVQGVFYLVIEFTLGGAVFLAVFVGLMILGGVLSLFQG